MRILAKSELVIAGFTAALIVAVPNLSSAQPLWPFDDLFNGLGSVETPARQWSQTPSNPKAQLIANVVPADSVNCEKAQAIVADYGFKDIKAEICSGATLNFTATRDGKPFSIRIFAVDGEFAEVKRLQ
jgi:hypothetical protein